MERAEKKQVEHIINTTCRPQAKSVQVQHTCIAVHIFCSLSALSVRAPTLRSPLSKCACIVQIPNHTCIAIPIKWCSSYSSFHTAQRTIRTPVSLWLLFSCDYWCCCRFAFACIGISDCCCTLLP